MKTMIVTVSFPPPTMLVRLARAAGETAVFSVPVLAYWVQPLEVLDALRPPSRLARSRDWPPVE